MSGSLRLAWLIVFGALFTAIGFALDLAWNRFEGVMFVICAVGLSTIAIAEVSFWHAAAEDWLDRRPIAALFPFTVAVACSLGTLYTNYSTSALGQDHKASEKLSAYNVSDDLDKGIREKSERVAILQKQLAAAPTRTSEAADAAIQTAMAHKFWTATDGCKATKGPQTRSFCDQWAAAVADKSNASAAVQARAELANEQAALAGLREKRGATGAVATKDNPAVATLISWGMTEQDARTVDSMMMPLVIQIILMLGGIRLAMVHNRDREPKSWLPKWLSEWVKGKAYTAATGRTLVSAEDVYAKAAEPAPAPLKSTPTPVERIRIKEIGIHQEPLEDKWLRHEQERKSAG